MIDTDSLTSCLLIKRNYPEGLKKKKMIISSCYVPVHDSSNDKKNALISPATKQDIPTNWQCDWENIWNQTQFECESIMKFSYEEQVLGLIKFGFYPYTGEGIQDFKFMEILNLECVPKDTRLVNPVGSWLIWHAAVMASIVCKPDPDEGLILLTSVKDSISYYRDKLGMDEIGWVTIAPGEDGYAFRFTKEGAAKFCRRQESDYGWGE